MKPQEDILTTEDSEKKIFKFKNSVNSVVSLNILIFNTFSVFSVVKF
jgi:hypothetical protein